MFRLKKYQNKKKAAKTARNKDPAVPGNPQDMKSLDMLMQKPKKVLHSKNPFKIKQAKIRLERRTKKEPLDGVTILQICKCELPEEVLKLNISGKGYSSIFQTDLKYFTNILEADISDNYLGIDDMEVLINLNKLTAHNNLLQHIQISENALPCLEELDLGFNNLSQESLMALPHLQRLKRLSVAGNNIEMIPPQMAELENLRYLDLSHNFLNSDQKAASLWRTLADFRGLSELVLSNNQLKGIHTEKLEAGDFEFLEILDFRNNAVDDQLKLICSRNFTNLKRLLVTNNPFIDYPYDYLEEELQMRVGAEVKPKKNSNFQLINETVAYKFKKHAINKRPIPIVFENIVVIKEDDFSKKPNTEFFGVDIPMNILKENQEKKARDREESEESGVQDDLDMEEEIIENKNDGFFMTGVSHTYNVLTHIG